MTQETRDAKSNTSPLVSGETREPEEFEVGEIVHVNHPRYTGTGKYQTYEAARPRMIGVTLQHGEIRWYEADTVTKIGPSIPTETREPEIPDFAREMYENLKAKDAAMKSRTPSFWEQELFKYIWVTDGKLLCNPEKIADVIERIRNEGRDSVLYIRCMKHRGGPQYNKDEYGQECTECAVQASETRVEVLEKALREARLGLSDCFGNIISGGRYDPAAIIQNTMKQIDSALERKG